MASEDRRSRRSRRLLRQAFIELVLERGYATVTVEDITERADLGRATFYSHYSDKDTLLEQIVTELIGDMQQRLDPIFDAADKGFTGKAMLEMFRHAEQERDAYRVVLRGEGDGRALRRFTADRTAATLAYFTAREARLGVRMRIEPQILAHTWVGEMVSTMTWWLESGSTLTPDQITEELLNLSLRGRYWAAGLSDDN
nr:TetR/AcrR family transcriptional regulator [Nocardia salmonicida]